MTFTATWLPSTLGFALMLLPGPSSQGIENPAPGTTVLGINGDRFTINGTPTFLLGCSYYGALGAPAEFVRRDLEDLQQHGVRWVRVWATWSAFGENVAAVSSDGSIREPYFSKLRSLISECDRRHMIVDVTLSRHRPDNPKKPEGGELPDFPAHLRAVETLCTALKPFRNWFLDLANERDVGDARFVGAEELHQLRERVRQLDDHRLVTASFGGHDLGIEDLRESLVDVGVDFVSRHRPRTPSSPTETEAQTRVCRDLMRGLGRVVPLLDQEPFRRGYGKWQPTADDFLRDLRGAMAGGAAGWCFHNGSQRDADREEPRRSFDLRTQRLMEQLDAEELKFLSACP